MEQIEKGSPRTYNDLLVDEKMSIFKARLKNPDRKAEDFRKEHNIAVQTLWAIERMSGFDKNTAIQRRMTSLMKADMKALEEIQSVNGRFIGDVQKKRTISNRDVDSLDKMSNTIMKRAVIVDKMTEEKATGEEQVSVTLTI